MQYDHDEAVAFLRRTPAVLRALLEGLPEPWITSNYGPWRDGTPTFSPLHVVGHLVQGEREDWIQRARIIIEQGETQTFGPFDRLKVFDEVRGRTLPDLLDEFEQRRASNLAALASLEIDDALLARHGTHPDFGRVSMRQLLATWVVHDLSHIAQVCKCLGWQYREEMGPWQRYVTMVQPPG